MLFSFGFVRRKKEENLDTEHIVNCRSTCRNVNYIRQNKVRDAYLRG